MFPLQYATIAQGEQKYSSTLFNFGKTTPWPLYPREIAAVLVVQVVG